MAEYMIKPNIIKANANEFSGIANEINKYASQLEAIASSGDLNNGSYGNLKAIIQSVRNELISEKKSIDCMREVLIESANNYLNTEKVIIGSNVQIQAISDAMSNGWDDIPFTITEGMDSPWYSIAEYALENGLDEDFIKAIEQILSGTYITSKKINNVICFKLVQDGMTNKQISKWLSDNIGGSWDDYLARNMKDYNFGVYNKISEKKLKKSKLFEASIDNDLSEFTKILNLNKMEKLRNFKNNFTDELFDNFNYKDFSGMSKLGKTAKVLGTVGTIFDIGSSVVDNFYDSYTGNWTFSANQAADCGWDVGVDLLAGAGSAAAGAAVGSLIVPPVGTVVGAVAGVAVDVAINFDITDFDGDGEKDSLVDGMKIMGHSAIDVVGDLGSSVVSWLGRVF